MLEMRADKRDSEEVLTLVQIIPARQPVVDL